MGRMAIILGGFDGFCPSTSYGTFFVCTNDAMESPELAELKPMVVQREPLRNRNVGSAGDREKRPKKENDRGRCFSKKKMWVLK